MQKFINYRILLGLMTLGLMSCGDDSSSESNNDISTESKSNLPSNPVEDYKKFFINELDQFKQMPECLDGTIKVADDYKFDVKKTESLVSPLVGQCTVTVLTMLKHDDETFYALGLGKNEVTYHHGYQKGKWVLTKGDIKRIEHVLLKCESRLELVSDAQVGATWTKFVKARNGTHAAFENNEELSRKLLNP